MEIRVTISKGGHNVECLAINTVEDLLHDYEYFLKKAKNTSAHTHETMFLHRRFLRAALLFLFAYAEAVVNCWVKEILVRRKQESSFERQQFDPLAKKIDFVNAAISVAVRPNIRRAKRVRNILEHFTPGQDGRLHDELSIATIEVVHAALTSWMTEVEKPLGVTRHSSSQQVIKDFGARLGSIKKSVGSAPE